MFVYVYPHCTEGSVSGGAVKLFARTYKNSGYRAGRYLDKLKSPIK
jgi:hypothetical protein